MTNHIPELRPARVHEAEGAGRFVFALAQAVRLSGPVIWISPAHVRHTPLLPGLPQGLGARLHLVRPDKELDLLWAAEESLRSRATGLVIAEPDQPLSLLAGRRLQLAAEAGRTTGLMLICAGQGSNAAETRWACAPQAAPRRDSTLQHWQLNKNKSGTTGGWTVEWNGQTGAVHMVCAAGQRSGAAPTPP
ncbi:MAG: hypothetical protein CR993_00770 [Rhodobacterales bacterium]|nr:MAG: hypothetical protein CR993_00770 [Rhodobacterales bacterium]